MYQLIKVSQQLYEVRIIIHLLNIRNLEYREIWEAVQGHMGSKYTHLESV